MDFWIDNQESFVELRVEGLYHFDLLANYIHFAIKERNHTVPARLLLDLRGLVGMVPSSIQMIASISADLCSHFPSSVCTAKVAIVRNWFVYLGVRELEVSEIISCYGTPVFSTSDYRLALEWICDQQYAEGCDGD